MVERLQVGPLSFGAVRRLLFERLGLTISRQRLRQIVNATGGNPLFALEVGRALLDDPERWVTGDLPLPGSLEEMLSERVSRLAPAVQRVLLAVALCGDPRVDQVLSIIEAGALDDAVGCGRGRGRRPAGAPCSSAAGDRSREPSRPRASSASCTWRCRGSSGRSRRGLCTWRSPASGLTAPSLARVAAGAEAARLRGSRREAALLAAQALRLTPPDAAERVERVLELAERLDDAGELRRMSVLLREALPSLPAGTPRARALLALSEGDDVRSREDQDRYLDQALGECGGDGNLRARLLAKKAGHAAAAGVSQLRQAETWARQALALATDQSVHRYALYVAGVAARAPGPPARRPGGAVGRDRRRQRVPVGVP